MGICCFRIRWKTLRESAAAVQVVTMLAVGQEQGGESEEGKPTEISLLSMDSHILLHLKGYQEKPGGKKTKTKKERERSPGKIGKKEALSFCLLFHCYHKLPDEARGETAYSVMYSEGPGQAWHLELLQNAEPA